METTITLLKDYLFRLRYGFKGVPQAVSGYEFRLDESLRRWKIEDEKELQDAIIENLKAGDTFIDIGANFGLHTLLGCLLATHKGRVLAVEPIPQNIALLTKNIHLNAFDEFCQIGEVALVNDPELTSVLMTAGEDIAPDASIVKQASQNTINVKARTLDALVEEYKLTPSLIKIDTEGAEHDILKGARHILSNLKPVLIIEVHTFALPNFGTSPEELAAFLNGFGYKEQVLAHKESHLGKYYHAIYKTNQH